MPALRPIRRRIAAAALIAAALAASPVAAADDPYRFLGALTLPNDARLDDTVIGGLSGIAYNDNDDSWYFISDDKSEHGPARYYAADITLTDGLLTGVRFKAMTPLKRPDGETYGSGPKGSPDDYVDAEAIAYTGKGIIWTSENSDDPPVQNVITSAALDGTVLRRYDLPAFLHTDDAHTSGPRDNHGLEALAVSPDGNALWLGVEDPLVQDGDPPDDKNGAAVRLTKINRDTATVLSQYAYPLEPLARAALPGKKSDGPGLADIAILDSTHLLTLERSWVEDVTNYVQVYVVDVSGATDIEKTESLKGATYEPVDKRLLIDLNKLGIQMDNYEGMALGPTLPDGRRLLVVCADNNFNSHQKTIIAAFAVDVKAITGE